MPDGTRPDILKHKWGRYVEDYYNLSDPETGVMIAWKYDGPYSAQPAYDMAIYNIIRQNYIRIKANEAKKQMEKANVGRMKGRR